MTTTEALSKSELAYRWISERVSTREYGPGYRLVLGDIARILDMSVVPVREAIRRLEAEGLISYERNVGARVALADPNEYIDTMQTLGVLEGAATAFAAPHVSAEALDEAAAVNQRMRELLTEFDPHRFTALNERFHTLLFETCPNHHLLDLVQRGWTRLNNVRDSTFGFIPARAAASVDEHDELVALLREGTSADAIELAARQHRLRTMNAYRDKRSASHPTNHSS